MKSRWTMPQKKAENIERLRLDLKSGDPLLERFRFVKEEHGVTQNTELFRILVKEEYDRLMSAKSPLDEATSNEILKLVSERPELGYKNVDEFVRFAIMKQMRDSRTVSVSAKTKTTR